MLGKFTDRTVFSAVLPQKKPKVGRNEPLRRKQYSVALKKKVVAWKVIDKLMVAEIMKRVKHETGFDIPKF